MSKADKYANLPYIAQDEPEVYETPDLPESDQDLARQDDLIETLGEEEANECIQNVKIDAKKSFERFNGAEFGDLISESTIETPLQQYQRLDSEVTNLAKTLDYIQKTREGRSQDFGDIFADITKLEAKLKSCKLAIDEIPSELKLQSSESDETPVKGKQVRKKEANPLTKLTYLEDRIRRLENLLDHDEDQLTCIYYFTNERNLGGAIRSISSKVALLDASILEQLDHRISSLIRKFSRLAEKRELVEDLQSKSRIDELYEIATKGEKHTAILYDVATRLNILAEAEEEALNFSVALTMLDEKTESNERCLQQSKAELAALKSSFQNLEQSVEKQLTMMEKRFDCLKK